MTREYYIKKYLDMGTEYLNIDLSCIVPKVVNEMLNDFENRKCKNCKYEKVEECIECLSCSRFYADRWEQNNDNPR